MYRVVLIDDERIIVEGLRRVVKWAEYHCEVVGTAYDAASGAAMIRSTRPDIVFTDIRMPDQDGLTMLAGLKSEFPAMQIAVLTGYRDFSYAQEAIRLGVCRYLLKPSKMDELHEALGTMTERLGGAEGAEQNPDDGLPDKQATSFIVKKAIAYIEQNYAKKLSLQEVADYCYVSQWHLSKLINKYAEKSYYDLLNSVRIEKAKELLALLIDRQGLSMTNGEIEAFLWEELHSPQYLQTLFYSLRKTLRGIGFEDLLIRTRNHTSIDVSKLHCDLYEFLKGSADAVNSYAGEYMNNYSWAELTNARLYNGTFSDFVLAAQARPRR